MRLKIKFLKFAEHIALMAFCVCLVVFVLLFLENVVSKISFSPVEAGSEDYFIENLSDGDFEVKQLLINKNEADFEYSIYKKDFRVVVIDQYLKSQNSPLAGLGQVFVDMCDKYGAPKDCTTVIAIAKIETNLCKYKPSQSQKNCWGFGGAGSNRYIFPSYSRGIETVTERLVNGYGVYYMENPNAMEMTYCGPRESCRIWGDNVEKTMKEMDTFSQSYGYTSLFSLRNN